MLNVNAFSLFKKGILVSPEVADRILYTGVPTKLVEADKAMATAVNARDWAAAKRSFDLAVALEPRWFLAYFRLGFVANELGNIKEAEKLYWKTLELEPSWAPAYYNLGRDRKQEGHYKEAIVLFEKSLELDPDDPDAFISLALCHSAMGDQPSEDRIYLHVIDTWPNLSIAHINYAINKRIEGKRSLARQHFERVLSIEASNSALYKKALQELKDC